MAGAARAPFCAISVLTLCARHRSGGGANSVHVITLVAVISRGPITAHRNPAA